MTENLQLQQQKKNDRESDPADIPRFSSSFGESAKNESGFGECRVKALKIQMRGFLILLKQGWFAYLNRLLNRKVGIERLYNIVHDS